MIPLDWLGEVSPPPGKILVERCRMETLNRAGLVLPDQYRDHILIHEAIVVSSDDPGYVAGERVLLSDSVGRCLVFGFVDEKTLWLVEPYQVLATLNSEEPVRAEFHREAAGYRSPRRDQDTQDVVLFDEGDSRGPR